MKMMIMMMIIRMLVIPMIILIGIMIMIIMCIPSVTRDRITIIPGLPSLIETHSMNKRPCGNEYKSRTSHHERQGTFHEHSTGTERHLVSRRQHKPPTKPRKSTSCGLSQGTWHRSDSRKVREHDWPERNVQRTTRERPTHKR